uniref:histidine kinase n=2 Tax=Desmonostoc muscorum TaxID=1179 RepID=A0A8J7A242_DESMC
MSALGSLVTAIAHEINNPINFIAGNLKPAENYIQDLLGLIKLYQQTFPHPGAEIEEAIATIDLDYLQEDLPKLISSLKEGSDRIRGISTSLRTFSRGDSDRQVPFNIHEGIDSTLLILKHRLKANEHRPVIEVVKDYGVLPQIECFPGQLNQVFMNILANAIDALEEANKERSFQQIKDNPNRITIKTTLSEDRHHILIHIQDNGLGISENVKQKLFDYLFTTKPVGKGTGLGLAISRQIIEEKHSGKLTVTSELGKGTELAIAIPVLSGQ